MGYTICIGFYNLLYIYNKLHIVRTIRISKLVKSLPMVKVFIKYDTKFGKPCYHG